VGGRDLPLFMNGREPALFRTPFYVQGSWALDPFALIYNALRRELMDLYAMMPYFMGSPKERHCVGLKEWVNWFCGFLEICMAAENEQLIPWARSAAVPGKAGNMARRSIASLKESQKAVMGMSRKLLAPEENGLDKITPYLAQLDELAFALVGHFKIGELQIARNVRLGGVEADGPLVEDEIVMTMMDHPQEGSTQLRRRMFVVALTLGIENKKNREAWIKGSRAISFRIQEWTMEYLASGRKQLVRDVTRGSGSESAEMEDENLGMGPRNKSKPAFSPDEDEQDVSIKEVLSGREPPLYMTPFYVEGSWALDPFAFMYNALKRKLMDLYAMMPYFAASPEEKHCNGLKDWFNWLSVFLRLCFAAENEQLIPWANSASVPGKAGIMARRSVASFKDSQGAVVTMQAAFPGGERPGQHHAVSRAARRVRLCADGPLQNRRNPARPHRAPGLHRPRRAGDRGRDRDDDDDASARGAHAAAAADVCGSADAGDRE